VIGNGIEGSLVAEPFEPRSGFNPIGPMARSDGGSARFALVGIFTERRFVVYESGSFQLGRVFGAIYHEDASIECDDHQILTFLRAHLTATSSWSLVHCPANFPLSVTILTVYFRRFPANFLGDM
jgi:hypothetical protein